MHRCTHKLHSQSIIKVIETECIQLDDYCEVRAWMVQVNINFITSMVILTNVE